MDVPASSHPIQIVLREPALERTRLTVLLRLFLAIPHLVWWSLWGIAAVVVLPVQWVWALIVGGAPAGLHRFYGAYVRLSVHLYAYLSLAADPFPPFMGEPGRYPVDVEIAPPGRQSRWSILFRLVLWLPPGLLAAALVGGGGGGGGTGLDTDGDQTTGLLLQAPGVLTVVAILAWFACLARARLTPGFRDLLVYCIGYAAQTYGYLALLTARYPDSRPALAHPASQPEHPVRAELVDAALRRARLLVLLRLPLAFPHFVWLFLWGLVAVLAAIVAWICALVTGRVPAKVHRFLAAFVRYRLHVFAFLLLAANPFPGFVGRSGTYPLDLEIDDPRPQRRVVTLVRLVLVVPAALVSGALGSAQLLAAIGGWWVALLTGRMPTGLRDLIAFVLRYDAQLAAYVALLTDRYPYSGPTLQTGPAHLRWLPPTPPAGRDAVLAPGSV